MSVGSTLARRRRARPAVWRTAHRSGGCGAPPSQVELGEDAAAHLVQHALDRRDVAGEAEALLREGEDPAQHVEVERHLPLEAGPLDLDRQLGAVGGARRMTPGERRRRGERRQMLAAAPRRQAARIAASPSPPARHPQAPPRPAACRGCGLFEPDNVGRVAGSSGRFCKTPGPAWPARRAAFRRRRRPPASRAAPRAVHGMTATSAVYCERRVDAGAVVRQGVAASGRRYRWRRPGG